MLPLAHAYSHIYILYNTIFYKTYRVGVTQVQFTQLVGGFARYLGKERSDPESVQDVLDNV